MEWYLSDHLGSTTLLVNESGLEVERTEYFPYGQVQSGGLEKYGFTGQENDIDTGLMYYGATYYSPEYRIFIQPDTLLPDVYNPQALNRYAYVLNNPVKYTDPSGHIAFIPLIIGAGMIGLTVMGGISFIEDTKAWNNYEMGTGEWIARSALNLAPGVGGISLKLYRGKALMQSVSKGYKAGKAPGAATVFLKSIPATFDDVAAFIATEGPLQAGKYAVDNIGSGIGATIEENTVGGTRLGDTSSSTKTSISSVTSSAKTSISSVTSSAKTSISSVASSVSSLVSSAASSTKTSISSVASSAKAAATKVINSLFRS
jgi:RHS repeat-associated protein